MNDDLIIALLKLITVGLSIGIGVLIGILKIPVWFAALLLCWGFLLILLAKVDQWRKDHP